MTFIVILISLVIERFFHWNGARNWQWFDTFQRKLLTKTIPPSLFLFISIIPILVVVGLVDYILNDWLFGLLRLIFETMVLVYCMGPKNLWLQTYSALNDLQQNPETAVEATGSFFNFIIPTNSADFYRVFTNAIFTEANQRIFGVIFWFILLGPIGAVLYRTIALSAIKSELGVIQQSAIRDQKLLDWLPVRVLTVMFALGGHFVESLTLWRKYLFKNIDFNSNFLSECGMAALNNHNNEKISAESSVKEALQLIDRSFIIGLVFFAMLVIMVR